MIADDVSPLTCRWCSTIHISRIVAQIAFSHTSDTFRLLEEAVSRITSQSTLHLEEWQALCEVWVTWPSIAFTYSAPWSTHAFLPALKLPRNSCDGAFFPWKRQTTIRQGLVSITCECTLTCEPKTHCTWENTMRVNPRNVAGFLQCAFSLEKTRNVGAVGRESYKFTRVTLNARHVLLEKTHGIWKGFRDARFSSKKIRSPGGVGRASYEFTVTMNARRILPEKTARNLGGLVQRAFSLKKHTSWRRWVTRGI